MSDYAAGIDVSRYQGVIDWQQVAASGRKYAAIRATVGNYYTDPQFTANFDNAQAAGLLVTAYHVVTPEHDAASQVAHFLSVLGSRSPDMPLVLDCELDRGQTPRVITANISAQVRLLPLVNGLLPLIYTNKNFGNTYMLSNCGCELWVANYTLAQEPVMPKWWATWRLWQWSCTGSVPGISSVTDLDRYCGDENDLREWLGLQVEPDPLLTWAHEIDAWARFEGYAGVHPPEL